MAEIAVALFNKTHPSPAKDAMCYKRGMPVVVHPDGWTWGSKEGLPDFAVIKIPGVSVEAVSKYVEMVYDVIEPTRPVQRRQWKIRVDDLPQAAIDKIKTTGQLVIKAGTYAGSYDYTWNQVKGYFRDLITGLDETGSL